MNAPQPESAPGDAASVAPETAAPVPAPPPDPLLAAGRLVGRPLPRVDGPLKVSGRATYSAEYHLPGLTYAHPVHSPIARGRIAQLDTVAAAAVPGVRTVMTYQNAPRLATPSAAYVVTLSNPLAGSTTTLPVMQTPDITWNGQIVALVVADTPEAAAHAARLVRVEYEAQPPRIELDEWKADAFVPEHVVFLPSEVKKGDATAALAAAPVSIDVTYHTSYLNQQAIEPHATVAHWPAPDRLEVYDATQYPSGVRDALAELFKLKPEAVRVLTAFVGGAFGGKVAMWQHVPLAAAASQLVGRPVQLVLPRASVTRTVGGRSTTEQRVALGATADGQLTALLHTGYSMCTQDVYAEQFSLLPRHLYAAPTMYIQQQVVRLDRVQNSFMRAPGETPGSFALESAMDELAYALNLDPLELRRRNEPARDPLEDLPFTSRALRECYALGAEKFGWPAGRPAPGTTQRGEWLVGTGVAAAFYPTNAQPAIVRARLLPDGTVEVRTSSSEMGVGSGTIQQQHLAERFGVALAQARFVQGDSDLPTSLAMGGSAATVAIGTAMRAAADKLVEELLKLAQQRPDSPLHGAEPAQVQLRAGGVYYRDSPTRGEPYTKLLAGYPHPYLEVEGSTPPPAEGEGSKYASASYGAHFCEVAVHELTREVRVRRVVSVMDCGRILNPRTARSQIMGGVIMGIGMALLEEAVYDARTGRLVTPDLGEYHVPVQADVPQLDVHFLDVPDLHATLGMKSVGELGIVGVAAAVANAVYHATGIRVRDLPITADKLL